MNQRSISAALDYDLRGSPLALAHDALGAKEVAAQTGTAFDLIVLPKSFSDEVSVAFYQFIRAHTTLSSHQMEFLNLLKNFIIKREKVEKKGLISAPFTVIHPQSIGGVFSSSEINETLQLTERLAA